MSSDLNEIRKKLTDALGDKTRSYFEHLKRWFQMKCTKQEFDMEARRMMTDDQVHIHNEFLLCLFSKCQSLALCQPNSNLRTEANVQNKRFRSRGYEPTDLTDFLPQLHSPPPRVFEEPARYCAQELFLPDTSLIFGRLLVAAWERDLEGAEESVAEYLVTAVQHFLKNILTAVFIRKNGYKIRERCFIYGMGSTIPNPWVRNTVKSVKANERGRKEAGTVGDIDADDYFVEPLRKPTYEDVEQNAAYEIACGCHNGKTPVTLYHILQALQVHPNIIPSYSVYSVYVEKVIHKLRHPSLDEIEAGS